MVSQLMKISGGEGELTKREQKFDQEKLMFNEAVVMTVWVANELLDDKKGDRSPFLMKR